MNGPKCAASKRETGDKLDMRYINSLGQLYGRVHGAWWPIILICVRTGLSRIDVCGMGENVDFSDFMEIKSEFGPHEIEKFCLGNDAIT